jgi:hypothetical protein
MANVNVSSPADADIVSQYPANERASREAIRDLTNGVAWWGGTSGGTANAHTVTISNTGISYFSGLRVAFIVGTTNTSDTAVTLNVNGLGAEQVKLRTGGTIRPGSLTSGMLVEVMYVGSSFRILAGDDDVVSQSSYDRNAHTCVGSVILRRVANDPNSDLPNGITATWEELAGGYYLRNTTGSPTTNTGDNTETGSGGNHNHTGSLTSGAPSATTLVESGGPTTVASNSHTHTVTIGNSGTHTHDIDLSYHSFRLWVRTA